MGGFFYIDYRDGGYTEVKFKTAAMAEKAYEMYRSEPEDNATGWGWSSCWGSDYTEQNYQKAL
jgi:hypothetical protein